MLSAAPVWTDCHSGPGHRHSDPSQKSESLNFERWVLCKEDFLETENYLGNYCNQIDIKAGLYFVNILEKF